MKNNTRGFSTIIILMLLIAMAGIGFAGWIIYDKNNTDDVDKIPTTVTTDTADKIITSAGMITATSWEYFPNALRQEILKIDKTDCASNEVTVQSATNSRVSGKISKPYADIYIGCDGADNALFKLNNDSSWSKVQYDALTDGPGRCSWIVANDYPAALISTCIDENDKTRDVVAR